MEDPFWTVVGAVWFALLCVVIVLRGYNELLRCKNERLRRRIEKQARQEARKAALRPGDVIEGGYVADEDNPYLSPPIATPVSSHQSFPPPYSNVAYIMRPGECPVCRKPWPLPGPLPDTMGDPVYYHYAPGPCQLCGRTSEKTSQEEAPP